MHRNPSAGVPGAMRPVGMSLPPAYSPAYTKPPTKRPAAKSDSWRLLVAVSSSLLWMISSSALIIANKQLYDGPLPYPMMVTGLGQVGASVTPPAVCLVRHPVHGLAAPRNVHPHACTCLPWLCLAWNVCRDSVRMLPQQTYGQAAAANLSCRLHG